MMACQASNAAISASRLRRSLQEAVFGTSVPTRIGRGT